MSNDASHGEPSWSAWLPPELAHLGFLADLPSSQLTPEEFVAFSRKRIAAFKKHAPELDRHKIQFRHILALIEASVAMVESGRRIATTSGDERLQAMADAADARTALVRTSGPIAERLLAKRPDDPELQEAKAHLDELRKHVPKEL